MSHEHENEKEFNELKHEIRSFANRFIEALEDIASALTSNQGAFSLRFYQIASNLGELNKMAFTNNLIGLTPGATAKLQIVPLDVNGNPIALDAGSTVSYSSSDSVNAPASADPADPSGLTMLVPVSAGIPASPVTFSATASLQKNGKTPTTGPVSVSVLSVVSGGAVSLGFNQLV